MKTTTRKLLQFSFTLLVLLGLLGIGPLLGGMAAQAAPAGRSALAALPAATCALTAAKPHSSKKRAAGNATRAATASAEA